MGKEATNIFKEEDKKCIVRDDLKFWYQVAIFDKTISNMVVIINCDRKSFTSIATGYMSNNGVYLEGLNKETIPKLNAAKFNTKRGNIFKLRIKQ